MEETDDLPQDSVDSAADGIENDDESNEQQELDPPDQGTAFVDSKEDMFVDAPEELNFDTPSKEALTTDDDDDDDDNNDKEVDREKELAVLQEQFNLLTAVKNVSKGEEDANTVEILCRFSNFLETAEEDKVQHEDALKELRGIISGKDDEIAHLSTKISDLSSSQDEEQLVAATDRVLVSLSNVFGQQQLMHGSSVSEKIAHLENGVAFLSAKYTEFYYGADQLRKCLSSPEADLRFQEDFGSALGGACSELLELKQKETSLYERLGLLEDENKKLVEQVNRDREMIESMNAESGKLKAELEQEKTRFINTKRSSAWLSQRGVSSERDALKHQISEKTTELENRLNELQEMKIALETSESSEGALEQSLAERSDELEKCYTQLRDQSASLEAYELAKNELEQSLAEKTKQLEECLMKLQEMSTAMDESELIKGELVKSEALVASFQEMVSSRSSVIENIETILSNIDAPEEGQSLDIIDKVRSLVEERKGLQNVSQEYNRLKDLDFSIDLPEELSQSSLETRLTWLRESFYRRRMNLKMSVSAEMEDKNNIRKELDDLTFSFKRLEETAERDSLEREEIVRRLVEISGLITEGVEHHTSAIDLLVARSFDQIEKKIRDSSDSSYCNEELIERFQSALYASDLELSLCKEMLGEDMLASLQVSNLSNELKPISRTCFRERRKIALETDLERSEEKSALLRDKLSMAIKKGKGLVQDREKLKTQLDEKSSDIEKLKLELQQATGTVDSYKTSTLASKLAETHTALKLVEDALSTAEGNINRLSEENRQLKLPRKMLNLSYRKLWERPPLSSELDEACATRNTLEAALKQAERNISDIISEKEEVQSSTATAEMELEKVKEEISDQNNKLAEAHSTIKSLEDTLAQTESNMESLSKQMEDEKLLTTNFKTELEELRNELELERSKMADTSLTIGSLEEALMKAENSLSVLQGEMVKAEVEISTLSSKLNVCMEELAGSGGNTESKSLEIITHLDNLQMLLKDGGLISRVNEFLEKKFRSLKDIDAIARDIIRNAGEKNWLGKWTTLQSGLDDSVDVELENNKGDVADDEDEISSSLRRIAEGVKFRNKNFEKNFEVFSTSIDTLTAALMENMTASRDDVMNVMGHNESLKEQVRSAENIVREQKTTISALQTDLSSLMSVCGEAASKLQSEVKNDLLELVQFEENYYGSETESTEHPEEPHVSECARRVKELSSATKKACTTLKLFETTSSAAAVVIQDMENRLKETSAALEKVVVERDLNQTKVSSSEAKVESTEAICQDLKLQLENFKAEEEKWHAKEVELSTLYDKLLAQEQESKENLINLIPASDMRALFDKISGIDVPSVDQVNGLDPQSPYDVKKLHAIVDSVCEMQHQIDLLSYGQNELNSTLAEKDLEIQGLKEAAEAKSTTELELVKTKNELSKLISSLEKLLGILAGNDTVVDSDFSESWTVLQALERKVASFLLESESSKSRAQELGLKLVSSEKLVDKLSLKVKELEDKLQSKAIQPDVVLERSVFEAPSTSEISEIEDKGTLVKNNITCAYSSRSWTVRKGSADHLSINIDSSPSI
ncbi:hypothetical protein Bca52824_064188 [Brassica carinata]|uniref:Uncharacterized protein n=1 Tax=Brassica carinata TaxID=52824 RepID=A0A8X7QGZ6_BRACI|nr:hypothetical protein Bca52824_064188 [Brassica carinata]